MRVKQMTFILIISTMRCPLLPCLDLWLVVVGWQLLGGGKLLRRFKQLIIPYFLWSLISFYVGMKFNTGSIIDIILIPDAYMWFLWTLFWIYCLFEICKWISLKSNFGTTLTIIAMGILLMLIMVILDYRLFGFQFIAYYYIFYALGYFFHKYDLVINNAAFLGIMTCVWIILAYYWHMHELPYWIPSVTIVPASILQYLYRGITSAIGVVLLLSIFPQYLNKDTKANHFFVTCGLMSLGLYVVHVVIKDRIHETIQLLSFSMNIYIFILLEFCLVLFLSFVIVKLVEKNRHTKEHLLGRF